MVIRERLYTAEEFFEFVTRPENEPRLFELHHGVIVEMPSPNPLHGFIVVLVMQAFMRFLEQNPLGYIFGDNNDYILAPDLVYKPDVSFVSKERLPSLPKHLRGAPDIAVEVISPSNSAAEMTEKVENYLRYGSSRVILIYPETKTVRVSRLLEADTINTRTLTAEDWLDGEDVLPGFRVQVKTLFPDLPVDTD